MCYLLGSFFCYLKVFGFKIVKEIASLKIFHYNINVVRIFKHIMEPYDIWMLAYLQHLNLPFQELQVLQR